MASKPNNALENRHTLILGTSGSGKTRWITKNADVRNANRVLLWDPEGDHRAVHCRTRRQYVAALRAALVSGKRFRLAYEPDNVTTAEFEWWCSVVWSILDGSKPTVCIVEEIADVTGAGKAGQWWGQLGRKGRKYNLQLFVVSQRPQEVDKTTVGQCAYKWCGILANDLDRRAVAGVLSIRPQDFETMRNVPKVRLHYWLKEPGGERAKLLHFSPK